MDGHHNRRLRERQEQSFRALRKKLETIPPTEYERVMLPGGWNLKQMLGHLAFWEEAVPGAVTLLFRKQQLPESFSFGSGYVPDDPWPRDTVHNAREAAWAADQPIDVVLSRVDNGHQMVLELIATVTAEEAVTHADYFEAVAGHIDEHLAELETALA
ncbi:hypothetical protein AYO38_03085 [bacterium SCGC AG-212-C10]|nr:hypothetical protein AYO38_03085 [bacterium SCGC AG-212-C10]